MSVYAVTTDNRVVQYDSPKSQIWLADEGDKWHIFYRNCTCSNCATEAHRSLIAYVRKASIVAIGFSRPAAVSGRLLTWDERAALTEIGKWLSRRKLPKKITRYLPCFQTVSTLALKA